MVDYTNTFETSQEASMRLQGTVVLYDGVPYKVLCVSDHLADGIFRIYLESIVDEESIHNSYDSAPHPSHVTPGHPTLGHLYDKFMQANPSAPVLRKMMNSPKFNKFRPFPLGMCNSSHGVTYIARRPQRKTEQGLTGRMLSVTPIHLQPDPSIRKTLFNMFTKNFRDCVLGAYPYPETCLAALLNPKVANNSVAFSRDFALVRGPLRNIFVAYRTDIIGQLLTRNFSTIGIAPEFHYTKEVVESLGLFGTVVLQD